MRTKILNEIIDIIRTNLTTMKYENNIDENTDLYEDLGFSSLDFIIFIVNIEEYWGIQFDDTDIAINEIKKISTIIDYIVDKEKM
jgi:acyl carrier protein